MDIVCLGELLLDMFPAELGRRLAEVTAFHPKPGGAPANVAVAAARLGARSAFIGKVGNEAFGRHLAEVLAENGVNVAGMRFDEDARTPLAFIAKPDANTNEYVFYRNPGADTRLSADELDRELLGEARAFHFGSLSLSDEPIRTALHEAIQIARGAGALVSFDVNYRPSLWHSPEEALVQIATVLPLANLVKVNETELALLTGTDSLSTGTAVLLERGPELAVVTLGPGGSYFATTRGSAFVPGFEVATVDATGCGDSFIAGLLCRLVCSGDSAKDGWRSRLAPDYMAESLRFANGVGAIVATRQGVIPALPTSEQVALFLAERG